MKAFPKNILETIESEKTIMNCVIGGNGVEKSDAAKEIIELPPNNPLDKISFTKSIAK